MHFVGNTITEVLLYSRSLCISTIGMKTQVNMIMLIVFIQQLYG